MRTPLLLSLLVAATLACAQSPAPRFIEVLVNDTVRLPFIGMDYEVRMPNPYEQMGAQMDGSDHSEKELRSMAEDAEQKAAEADARFVALMKENGFNYRLRSTEHAEDYLSGTGRKVDVNTYLVMLKGAGEAERYFKLVEGSSDYYGTIVEQHFATPDSEAPRLMKKLFDQAQREATALASVSGGRIGQLISAQEVQPNEGSVLELLFRLDRMKGDGPDSMAEALSTHRGTMAFRFELLAK